MIGAAVEDTAPGYQLSPHQVRLWRLRGDRQGFVAQCALLAEGDVRPDRMRGALERLVARHEALRTVFRRAPGHRTPSQVVLPQGSLAWREIDGREVGGDAAAGFEWVERLLLEAHARPAADEAPLQATLVTLAPDRRVLVLSLPALCADSRSLANLAVELARVCAGEDLPEDNLQYAQFSAWQRELVAEDDEEARAFWSRQRTLQGAEAELLRARTITASARRRSVRQVDPAVLDRCRDLTRQLGVGLPDLLLMGWQVVLWRSTGRTDVVTRRLFDGRELDVLEAGIGLYARCLPVSFPVEPGLDVGRLLRRLSGFVAEAAEWQAHFPWDGEEAAAAPTVGFEVRAEGPELTAGGLSWRTLRRFARIEPHGVELRAVLGEGRLEVELESAPEVLDEALHDLLLGRFVRVLESLAQSSPETPVERLTVVPEAERRALAAWATEGVATDAPPRAGADVLGLFEAQVRDVPERVAVAGGDVVLSFGALDRWAESLARQLRSAGVGPQALVGVAAERAPETVAALLAVAKAGAAYVPLDPSLPAERLRAMSAGIGLVATVVQEAAAGVLPPSDLPVVVLPQRPPAASAGGPEPARRPRPAPEDLVYALYTSGSTGDPKAVGVEHRQLAHYVAAVSRRMGLGEGACYGLVSTFAADLGNTALFPALCSGGRLEVASPEEAFDPDRFADFCAARRLDCLKIVPSHLEAVLRASRGPVALGVRLLVLGGEAASPNLLEAVAAAAPACAVLNHYGPTEVTVGACAHRAEASGLDPERRLPLGRPLDGYRLYSLDPELGPVPLGAPGELFVGGAGIARGYVGRPALTAERFLPDPFSACCGTRVYRTGDLVRLDTSGRFEFRGRLDHQVKVRGFRVELGEIEACLRRQPGIADAAVLARREDAGSTVRLEACLVPAHGRRITVEEVRGQLEAWLPEPMIPGRYALLDSLPLTPNGKVDRRSLFDLESVEMAQELREFVAPRTPVEEVLAGIWAEVLGAERIGVEDDFFALGGHSLLAMQILARVQDSFGMELPLRVVFQSTTVSALAEAVVAMEPEPGLADRIARTVQRVEAMSPEEVETLLAAEGGG